MHGRIRIGLGQPWPRRCSHGIGIVAVTVLVAACGGSTNTSEGGEDAAIPAFDAETLSELPRDHWITNGGNVLNQRYFPPRPDQPRQRGPARPPSIHCARY